MADDKIEGMDKFLKVVSDIPKQLETETQKAAQQIAKDWIAAARNKAGPSAKGPANAFSIRNDSNGALLVNDDPRFFGEEFGGQARPSTMQFPPHQGQRGYFLFPAARENADKFQKIWEAAVDTATKGWDSH